MIWSQLLKSASEYLWPTPEVKTLCDMVEGFDNFHAACEWTAKLHPGINDAFVRVVPHIEQGIEWVNALDPKIALGIGLAITTLGGVTYYCTHRRVNVQANVPHTVSPVRVEQEPVDRLGWLLDQKQDLGNPEKLPVQTIVQAYFNKYKDRGTQEVGLLRAEYISSLGKGEATRKVLRNLGLPEDGSYPQDQPGRERVNVVYRHLDLYTNS